MDRHIQNERMRAELIKQALWVKKQLKKGKGTWPKPGYVRDSIWDSWHGREFILIAVLRAGEIDYYSLQEDAVVYGDIQSVEIPGK